MTSRLFARNGYRVFACVRNKKSGLHIENATIICINVDDDNSVTKGIAEIVKQTDTIDVLINNAGFGFVGPVEDFSILEMKEQFETNYFGQMRMIKAVLPYMRKNKSGMIINISSINGLVSFPLYGLYSASKFALETTSEALAFELAPFGVRVVLVEPGTFLTNFTANRKRPKQTNTKNSPYVSMTTPFFQKIEHLKDASIIRRRDPAIVANLLLRISETKNPRLRYKVGYDAHIFHLADRLLPKSVKFWLMRRAYHWPE